MKLDCNYILDTLIISLESNRALQVFPSVNILGYSIITTTYQSSHIFLETEPGKKKNLEKIVNHMLLQENPSEVPLVRPSPSDASILPVHVSRCK